MSVLSGYPVGAKLTADFYEKGLITKGQACRITTFTSTSGPLFIVGTVGIGMFHSAKLGIIILLSHFIGAILNGLIYRKYML
jgi:nucleoside recognition membrane protein YjiH